MKVRIKNFSVCVIVLLGMILLPMGVFAAEGQSGGLDLPSLDSQTVPSSSAVPSASPSPSVAGQPSTGEQTAATPSTGLTPSPSVEPSAAQPTAAPSTSVDASTVTTQADSSSDFTTTDVEGGVKITKYTGNVTDLVIPATIGEKKVLSIGSYFATNAYMIKSVTLSEGIVTIENSAFSNFRQLSQITIPSTLTTIGQSAFLNTDIRRIHIPASVTSIGSFAFDGNLWIYGESGSVAETYAQHYNCAFISPDTLKSGDYYYKANTQYTDDNGVLIDGVIIVAYVGSESSISISKLASKNVVAIGSAAFTENSKLTDLTIADTVYSVGDYAFNGCSGLTNVAIGDGVKIIGSRAFESCTKLTKVVIPDSVTSIGYSAFSGCSSLEEVTIGSGVTELKSMVFGSAYKLTHIDIPKTVTTISDNALGIDYSSSRCDSAVIYGTSGSQAETFAKKNGFVFISENTKHSGDFYYEEVAGGIRIIAYSGNATNLDLSQLDNKPIVAIGDGAFFNQKQLTNVNFGSNVQSIGSRAFSKSGLLSIELDDAVRSIGDSAFDNCPNLSLVTLNDGLESVGARLFYETPIKKIKIPDSVTEIPNEAFANCHRLKEVTLSTNLKSIGDGAFSYCNLLKQIDIPDGVETIGYNAFSGCGIDKITLPDSVTTFVEKWNSVSCFEEGTTLFGKSGSAAQTMAAKCKLPFISEKTQFSDGYYYEDVIGGVKIIKADNPLKSTLPSTLRGKPIVEIGYYAFRHDMALEIVDCSTLKSIGYGAFQSCGKLKQVILYDVLTTMDDKAFANCGLLESVQIGSGIKTLPANAFFLCSMLKKVLIPSTVTAFSNEVFDSSCKQLVIYGEKNSAAEAYAITNQIRFMSESSINEGGYYYEAVADGVKIVAIDNPGKSGIPEKLGGQPVVEIGDYAFDGDTSLSVINNPYLKVIGKGAFYGCTGLTNVTLNDGATSIGDNAFYGCSSLKKVIVPASVTQFGIEALGGKPNGLYTDNQDFFYIFGVKGSAAETYAKEYGVRFITEDTPKANGYYYEDAEDGVKVIASDNPNSPAIPEILNGKNVIAIGALAFENEQAITSAKVGKNVKSIGDNAFINCKNLKSTTVSNNTASLGAGAFSYCSSLSDVSLGIGISTIQSLTFAECTSLTSITLPASIKKIEGLSFYRCDNLQIFTIPASAMDVKIETYAVRSEKIEKAYLPAGVSAIQSWAFYSKGNGNYIQEPNNLMIYGAGGSAAEKYAKDNDILFGMEVYSLGDVNADGSVNASDALQDLRHSVNEIQLKGTEFSAGDVTKDGTINASDALQILRYSVKEITSF